MSGRKPPRRGSSYEVHEYLKKRPGETIFTRDIARAVGMTQNQASNAVSVLIRQGAPIERVGMGVYKYTPTIEQQAQEAIPPNQVQIAALEYLGTAIDGSPMVRDENGKLYRLVEL